jgi:hypothetical protein
MLRAISFPGACLLISLAAVWAQEPSAPAAPSDEVLLENELVVSGPQVWLHLRYGAYYHPGALLLAEGRMVWPGGQPPQCVTGITVAEGSGPNGPRYGVRFPAGGASVFSFAFQAPAGAAELTFSLWQDVYGEPQDLLRTSLVSHLKVLPAQGRVVLRCGQVSRLVVPAQWHEVSVTPGELPEQAWMFENVDLVILGRGAFQGVSDAALTALRNWVVGGGRVLIASVDVASAEVLDGAVRAGLTPIPRDSEKVPERTPLWPGMKDDPKARDCEARFDADAGWEVVYAHYRLGLGGGLFFMPSANPNSVARVGIRVFDEPLLSAPRPLRSDVRVWRQPFEFFAPGALPHERRVKTGTWALIGAACVLAMLAFARSIRTRYLAAGLSLAAIGLLSSLLARTFPQPELTLARVEWVDVPLDGRAQRTTEWALCEGAWGPRNVTLSAPRGATLSPLYYNPRELREAVVALNGEKELVCRLTSPRLPPSAPLFQCVQVREMTGGAARILDVPGEQVRLRVPSTGFSVADMEKGTIWMTDDGRRLILRPEGGTYRADRLTDERRYVQDRFPKADVATVGAWAKALGAALDEARSQGRSCLVRCADRLTGEGLIQAQGVETEIGICFSVQRVEVEREALPK